MQRKFLSLGFIALCLADQTRNAEIPATANSPTVIGAAVPFYPLLARSASVQGTVVVEVTTHEDRIGSTKLTSGNPLLSTAALANLQTWIFVNQLPSTFKVTYRYKIDETCQGNPTVTLNLPTEILLCSRPNPTLD